MIKRIKLSSFFLLLSFFGFSQNIRVDSQTYTPQQLIEDILINSNCIENIDVMNVIGGDFNGSDESFGYFDAIGTTFPFQSGIVLSTGRLLNTEGPNTSLSDDDAPNWGGDTDLENALNESNTTNATLIEFDFSTVATQISFRYLFASEEYQQNDDNTCQFSDLFGFLIRPANQTAYTNIALVPGTTTPVKVTTVHPDISANCLAINQAYFGQFNASVSPINFNGQTTVLTATASVVPNQLYHVKLVIADEQNYRYDSAVFLEAASFILATDLGVDLLNDSFNALCETETIELDAIQPDAVSYAWFKNGALLPTETTSKHTVISEGDYAVEVTLTYGCISYGDIVVEYNLKPTVINSTLIECDLDQDGVTFFDLFDAQTSLTNNDQSLFVNQFYETLDDATLEENPIQNPTNYQNSTQNQIVYANIVSSETACSEVAELTLSISNNQLLITPQFVCDRGLVDGISFFDLNDITTSFQSQIPPNSIVNYYASENDAFSGINNLTSPYENSTPFKDQIFVKVTSNNECFGIEMVELNVLFTPSLNDDYIDYYCTDTYPTTKRIDSEVLNGLPNDFTYQWFFNNNETGITTSFIDVNEIGVYSVVVTASTSCIVTQNITIQESSVGIIDEIRIEEGTYNNTVSIEVSGVGSYEYALDDEFGIYNDSPIFTNVFPGFYTVYVRDKKGCGITSQLISVLGFPKFFTPNNDGVNDTWKVFGVGNQFNQGIDILIYNRFGKLLSRLNNQNNGWNGIYNGVPVPASDYWYQVILEDGAIYKGHFALKR